MEAPDDFYDSLLATLDSIGTWQAKNNPVSAATAAKGATWRQLDAEKRFTLMLLFALGGRSVFELGSALDQDLVDIAFAEIVSAYAHGSPVREQDCILDTGIKPERELVDTYSQLGMNHLLQPTRNGTNSQSDSIVGKVLEPVGP